jgi:hypothetical protein
MGEESVMELYEGWSVRDWASWQTRNPKPSTKSVNWYTGYHTFDVSAWELGMPEIPLHIRYDDFKARLEQTKKPCCT